MPGDRPDVKYNAIVRALGGKPGVTRESGGRKGFGSSGQLKVNDRIFAMLVNEALVVKLPKARVDSLVASKLASRFDPRRDGRLMKEWAVIPSTSKADWMALAREALSFAAR